ncbi:MAG: ATP phosphoribosyltransferase regulatory subunit [Dehalococcoidia bacterium]|nr:ATP phosphoribosyltransferase regulatory subunit [Dehalococcoidia bacterium]
MRTVSRLQGMRDLAQESWHLRRDLQDRLMALFSSFGYGCLETPILEATELFLRKSGGELASRIYSFTDSGGAQVSLRPEFTSSILRHYLENSGDIELPARWQYAGPVFRYEVSHPETSGQFTQVGAELVGAPSMMADFEVLGLAALVPEKLGISGWRLELADLDVLNSVLDAVGVSERAKTFIVASVPRLKEGGDATARVLEEAHRLRLTGRGGPDDYLGQAIDGLDDGRATVVLHGLLQWSAAGQLGQRNAGEVVDRLLRKLRGGDDENSLRRGLELARDLAMVGGEPRAVLEAAGAVVRAAGADSTAFGRLSDYLDLLLAEEGIASHLVLDFGLVRGLAYYNGIVFEVKHPDWPGALGGGGRYDGLARALGSEGPLPALGFAYNLDALLALTRETGGGSSWSPEIPDALVLAAGPGSYPEALRATVDLRRQGLRVELEVTRRELEQAISYAAKKGIKQVVVVHQDGRRTTHAAK